SAVTMAGPWTLGHWGWLRPPQCPHSPDCIQVARAFEACRQRCGRLGLDLRRAREQLLAAEAERSALDVRLQHARNQVRVEMKKRHRAEAELEKQVRSLVPVLGRDCWRVGGSGTGEGGAPALAAADWGAWLWGRRGGGFWAGLSQKQGTESPAWNWLTQAGWWGSWGERAGRCLRVRWVPGCAGYGGVPRGRWGAGPGCPLTPPFLQIIRPESCATCGSRARFGRVALRCRRCRLLVHPECRGRCPSPCTPGPRAWPREGILADFAPPTVPRVPALVVQCVSEVERRGLTEAGLYRVPGAEPLVREWKQKLLRAKGAAPSLGRVADVHVVCGVLKDFLRGLREPLVTFRLHPAFLQAADIPDEAASQAALAHLVNELPQANRDTLAFLMLHLLRVTHSPECKMDRLNLARVFGPTLVGHSSACPTPLAILEDTPQQCKVGAVRHQPQGGWRCSGGWGGAPRTGHSTLNGVCFFATVLHRLPDPFLQDSTLGRHCPFCTCAMDCSFRRVALCSGLYWISS
uniref:Uncharacterized protein n=1 Tax=Pelusios castaneus TaxID=367368 RepID=A0A8C8SGN5_9SAUR